MSGIQAGSHDAVLFFKGDLVDKEMLYPEFEAVLDGYIGLTDYSGKTVRAVFLQISPRLKIKSAVFFTIGFNDSGAVESSWNIPLMHLADHGHAGPDLGEGAIRLACRSACPVSWYKEMLWDPQVQGSSSTFDLLRKTVERNRLGLLVERAPAKKKTVLKPTPENVTEPSQTVAPDVQQSQPEIRGPVFHRKYRRRLENLKQKHRLEISTLSERLKRRVESVEAKYSEKLEAQEEALSELKKRLSKSRRQELELKESLGNYEQRFNKIKDHYEDSLRRGSDEYAAELEILRDQFAQEIKDKLSAQASELNERIAMRETELHYRDQQIGRLRDELLVLKKEYQAVVGNDEGQVLQRMTDNGITFVAFHPGIEHLVLAPAEISEYLKNPPAFVAERCDVSEQHYRNWLVHYRLPICRYVDEHGETCGDPIDKILKPKFFHPGVDDRCKLHREQDPVGTDALRELH